MDSFGSRLIMMPDLAKVSQSGIQSLGPTCTAKRMNILINGGMLPIGAKIERSMRGIESR